jgi:RNA polymerase sigma-70 factor (ECF subfamily)
MDEVELDDAWEAARAAWPGVDLDRDAFVAHVRGRQEASELHLADLYLACAAAAGIPAAIEIVDRLLLPRMDAHVRRIDASPAFVDEARQRLRERLLVGRGDGSVRLADYAGKSPLASWLRVAAVRVASNLRTELWPRREQPLDDVVLSTPDNADPELELLRARYAPIIRTAVRAALVELSARERTVLRFHLVAGMSTAKIAAMYHVNQSTVARWVQAARQTVRERTNTALVESLGVAPAELHSLAGLLLSRLDLSLSGLLREDATA